MDAVDIISHINDIINSNLSDKEKVTRIENEISEYYEELMEDKL